MFSAFIITIIASMELCNGCSRQQKCQNTFTCTKQVTIFYSEDSIYLIGTGNAQCNPAAIVTTNNSINSILDISNYQARIFKSSIKNISNNL